MRSVVEGSEAGARLDVYLAGRSGDSRARAGSLIDAGDVSVNGRPARKSQKVAAGDVVEVRETSREVKKEVPDVEIVFEDEHLLVVNKPSGVVVHGGAGVREATLVDALEASGRQLAAESGEGRAGIVHRLDKDVSGLLVVAKTDETYRALVQAMKERLIERTYLALVSGEPATDRGKIDAPLGRDRKQRTRMAVVPEGRDAVTHFAVRERLNGVTLLEVKLETGRTHQIRAHLAAIDIPVLGDRTYGRDRGRQVALGLKRPFLHAWRLSFDHPVTSEVSSFESGLPHELEDALATARKR